MKDEGSDPAQSCGHANEHDLAELEHHMSNPAQSIFNFNAYSPVEIEEAIETIGVKKTNLPFLTSFMLSVIAGSGIGLGALYYSIVASDAELGFAATRVLGGLVISLGLALVLVGGAELF